MVATSVARLTVAPSTPGVLLRNRSIRLTQDAQLIGPWGPVHVAATERGVVAVEWLEGAADVSATWCRRFGADVVNWPNTTALNEDPLATDSRLHLLVATAALEAIFEDRSPEA